MIRYQNHLNNRVGNDRIITIFRIYCTADRFKSMRHWLMVHYHYIQLYVVRYKFSLLGRCYTCPIKEARKGSSVFVRNDDTSSNTLPNNDHS